MSGACSEFVVPRTARGVFPGNNVAKNPEQFANLLTQKLEVVKRDRDAQERVQQAFRKIQEVGGRTTIEGREASVIYLIFKNMSNRSLTLFARQLVLTKLSLM